MNPCFCGPHRRPRLKPQRDFLFFSQDDGPDPKIHCYIEMKNTWSMMNILKLAAKTIHDTIKLLYV